MLEMVTLVNAADDPFMQGKMARAKGESTDACPYDWSDPAQDDDRADWIEGFNHEPVWRLEDDDDA